ARGSSIFVTIHGWQPNPAWDELKKIAIANGFRVEAKGPGFVGSVQKKSYRVGKQAFTVETRINADSNVVKLLTIKVITNKLNEIFSEVKRKNPQGYMDSFEQQLPNYMMDLA